MSVAKRSAEGDPICIRRSERVRRREGLKKPHIHKPQDNTVESVCVCCEKTTGVRPPSQTVLAEPKEACV